ncbi:MAG: patatin-like phospholipase family protein [Pseudomonadales bacterium]|nr:patatin-like phospholipase family protein [Pseudomonadales bacterium]
MKDVLDLSQVKHVVFAGGGNRCFWQAGFWSVAAEPLNLKLDSVVSVSAGAAISCVALAGKIEQTLDVVKKATGSNIRNIRWENLFRKGKRLFPHDEMYREMLREVLDDSALARIKLGPANRIHLARHPRWLTPRMAIMLGMCLYQLEKSLRHPVHPSAGKFLGFKSEFVDAKNCTSTENLAELILSSSCTPPVTRLMRWGNRLSLDGGLVDNVPVHGVDMPVIPYDLGAPPNVLGLLTRCYRNLPQGGGRLYLQPSERLPVSCWDYTNPARIQAAFDLGRRDAERVLKRTVVAAF